MATTVILDKTVLIGGEPQEPGYEHTTSEQEAAYLVHSGIASYKTAVDTAMDTTNDMIEWWDRSLNRSRTSSIKDFLLEAGTGGLVWTDLLTPASGINLPGAVADAKRDSTTGMIKFEGNADEVIAGSAQMPHSWAGTPIRPHIHLRFPTAAADKATRWLFEYDRAAINGDFTNDYGTYTTLATITVANPNNAKKSVIASFGELDMTGYGMSTCIAWRITRLASSDELDTDTGDVILTDFDIHYQLDSSGSRRETSKT